MTGLLMRRRRWVAATMMGLTAAGAVVGQASSPGVLPPPSAIAIAPVPVPSVPVMSSAATVPVAIAPKLPPLVVTPPAPPVKPVTSPPPALPAQVPEPPKLDVPEEPSNPPFQKPSAPPAERILPIEIELHPPVFAPRKSEPAPNVEPKTETVPVPDTAKSVPVPDAVTKPAVPASKASIVKPVKVAVAEIIAVGPKPVDATAAFTTALVDAKTAFSKVRDYTGHLIVQEQVKGQLGEEMTAEIRERVQPRGVAVKFIAPSSRVGRELVYLEGRHGNKVRAKNAGTYGPLAFGSFSLSDAKAAVTSRHTLADIGLAGVIDRLERALITEAKLRNPVAVTAADFTFAGRTVTRYEIHIDRPHALRDAARLVVCIDPDTKLPVRLEVYDAPSNAPLEGILRESISFVNLNFNQGLGDAPFEK